MERWLSEENLGTFSHMITRAHSLLHHDENVLAEARPAPASSSPTNFRTPTSPRFRSWPDSPAGGQHLCRRRSRPGHLPFSRSLQRRLRALRFPLSQRQTRRPRKESRRPRPSFGAPSRSSTRILRFLGCPPTEPSTISACRSSGPAKRKPQRPACYFPVRRCRSSFSPARMPRAPTWSPPSRRAEKIKMQMVRLRHPLPLSLPSRRRRQRTGRGRYSFRHREHGISDTPEARDLFACLNAIVSAGDDVSLFRVAALPASTSILSSFAKPCAPSLATIAKPMSFLSPRRSIASMVAPTFPPASHPRRNPPPGGESPRRARHHRPPICARCLLAHSSGRFELRQRWEKKKLNKTIDLEELVDYLGLFREAGGVIPLEANESENAVRLMTVHGARAANSPTSPFCAPIRIHSLCILPGDCGCFPTVNCATEEFFASRRQVAARAGRTPPLLRRDDSGS